MTDLPREERLVHAVINWLRVSEGPGASGGDAWAAREEVSAVAAEYEGEIDGLVEWEGDYMVFEIFDDEDDD